MSLASSYLIRCIPFFICHLIFLLHTFQVFGVDIHPGIFVSYFNLTMFLMLLVIKFHSSYMTSSSYKKGKRAMCFCCMKQLIISLFLFEGLHGDFCLFSSVSAKIIKVF